MYDMINIFEVFLPQLLRYPNPTDPLNGEAAALLMREPKSYDVKVRGMSNLRTRASLKLLRVISKLLPSSWHDGTQEVFTNSFF